MPSSKGGVRVIAACTPYVAKISLAAAFDRDSVYRFFAVLEPSL